jgi:hypothetical protein
MMLMPEQLLGKRVRALGRERFRGSGFWKMLHLVIIIIIISLLRLTTKARRHKGRTKRFVAVSIFAILAGYGKQRLARLLVRYSWAGSCGPGCAARQGGPACVRPSFRGWSLFTHSNRYAKYDVAASLESGCKDDPNNHFIRYPPRE